MEMKEDESQSLRLRVDQISSKLDKQDRVRAVNTKWMLTVGAAIVAALGYTNFVQLPREAAKAAKKQVGPDVVKKAEQIVNGLQEDEVYAKKIRDELGKISDLKKIADLPIGTIVPSMLEPSKFAEAAGDPNRTTWVLADGQPIAAASRYGQLSNKKKTPDLRGMFLRGMNEKGGLDPNDHREPGDYQPDALQKHGHNTTVTDRPTGYQKGAYPRYDKNGIGYTRDPDGKNAPILSVSVSVSDVTGANAADETRPKNVAVYFYIKIN